MSNDINVLTSKEKPPQEKDPERINTQLLPPKSIDQRHLSDTIQSDIDAKAPLADPTFTGTVTMDSPVINTAISGTAFLDEDSMTSDSATKVASQQSIKAYADTKKLYSKTGSLTRDLTTASGDVSYTGVGFTPTSIHFYSTFPDISLAWGFSDSTKAAQGVYYRIGGVSNISELLSNAGANVVTYAESSANNYQAAIIKSYDADGFTLTWTKVNSPTGTGKIVYVAYK